jgi:hypothetical protein
MDLLWAQRCMFKQALTKVSEISIRVTGGRDSLVNLHHMHSVPGHVFAREITKHEPWGFAAADCHDK